MNYGEIIESAFRITWRNKFLWIFGFFLAAGGNSANVTNNFTNLGGDQTGGTLDRLALWISENLVLFIVVVALVGLVLFLVSLFLWTVSNGALAEGVAAIDRGESRRFGQSWRAGLAVFWRVLGQAVVFFALSLLLTILVGLLPVLGVALGFLATQDAGTRIAVVVLAVLLFLVLALLVFVPFFIVVQLALRALVVGRERILDSVGAGFALLRRNLGRSLLVWLVQVGLSIAIGVASLLVFLLVGLVTFGPAAALFFADQFAVAMVLGVVGGLVFLAVSAVISGALGTFNHAYWTLAYLRLTGPENSPGPSEPTAV